jgi:hypothetical protein
MNRKLIIEMMTVFLLITVSATAQKKKKQNEDSLNVYREFARMGQLYMQLPLQMNVHFVYKSIPMISDQDSAETDMVLYYGKNDFYMQAEGMEQIANDTLLVMVNNESKMISLYPNNRELIKNLENMVSVLMPDSSLEKLALQYSGKIQDEGKSIKRIILQSRNKISGTDLFKETINVVYDAATFQPLAYDQAKLSLLPIDSTVYRQLSGDTSYAGRLIGINKDGGNLFFVVKEKMTQCRFTNITHDQQVPPAREQDRVVRLANGEYQPAKGFENFLLSKEF